MRRLTSIHWAWPITLVWLVLGARAPGAEIPVPEEAIPVRFVTQTVEIAGATPEARIEVLPLYKGLKWAFTSRWDDSCGGPDVTMGRLLSKYGYKGTFYPMSNGLGVKEEQTLLKGGHAIGSHSITHPGLTECNCNKIFEELLRSRIDIEARTDVPVNAFAFPGNGFVDAKHPGVEWQIYRLLQRSGYVQVAWSRLLPESMRQRLSGDYELAGDGSPLEPSFSNTARNEAVRKAEPNITLCTHAWAFEHGKKWPWMERELKKRANNPDFWYCTQADYGAYRFQFRRVRVENVHANKDGLAFDLIRPAVLDAGRPVPLSLRIGGQNLQQASVLVDGKAVATDAQDATSLMVSIPYGPSQRLPERIDAIEVAGKPVVSQELPFLQGALGLDTQNTELTLELKSMGAALQDIDVTFRLPYAAEPGILRKHFAGLSAGQTLKDTVALKWPSRSSALFEGRAMFVAQVDFVKDGKPNRLYMFTYKQISP
jgi:peptidoglycan/xylan/chitin deacetylase (PgdA/CDA1 family)